MRFDIFLVPDCCANTSRIGLDGTDYDSEVVHDLSVANMHGEFCTTLSYKDVLDLVVGNVEG